jgi:lipoprotein signal peptidase
MHIPKAPRAVLATMGAVFAVDQIAKAIIRHELTLCSAPPVSLCDRVTIVEPLGLLRTENGDGAFGFLAGDAIGPVMVVLLGILLWQVARLPKTPLLGLAGGLLLGGWLANIADRALYGVVTDFIDLRWGLADKGVVLNPADIALAIGGLLLAVLLYRAAARSTPSLGPFRAVDPVSNACHDRA